MKDLLEKRPLLIACLSLIIALSGWQHPLNFFFLAPLYWLNRRSWAIAGMFLVVGLLFAPRPLPMLYEPHYAMAPLVVQSVPQDVSSTIRQGGRLVQVEGQSADGLVDGLRVRFRAPATPILRLGDVLQISDPLRPVSEVADTSYRNQRIQAVLRLTEIHFLRRGPAIYEIPGDIRRDYGRFIESTLTGEERHIAKAAWFRAGDMPQDEQSKLLQSGLYGYFGASGIQVYMLCGCLMAVLSSFRVPRAWQAPFVAAVLIIFTVATGIHASTFRASLVCVLFLISFWLSREPDSITSLSLAGILFLLVFPTGIYSRGFQLTMTIVAAICLFVHLDLPEEKSLFSTVKHRAKQLLAVCLAIWFAGEPIWMVHAGVISLSGLPAILLLGLVISAILLCCLFSYCVHWILPAVAIGIMKGCTVPLLEFVLGVMNWLANHDLSFTTPFVNSYWLVVYYGAWLLTWRPRAVRP
ncbi:MAG TPA: ComEC/Rec2 family competence protein [Fimbriimonas sp.]|nr:ComEC/Rec2 family competence protein [Fimbriimonas sp.]